MAAQKLAMTNARREQDLFIGRPVIFVLLYRTRIIARSMAAAVGSLELAAPAPAQPRVPAEHPHARIAKVRTTQNRMVSVVLPDTGGPPGPAQRAGRPLADDR